MKKLLVALLCAFPACLLADAKTIVIAASDFQASGLSTGQTFVSGTLSAIQQAGYKTADGFLFCGDYTTEMNRPEASEQGMSALKTTLFSAGFGLNDNNSVFIQGNHDPSGTRHLAASGAQTVPDKKYGVFVINEDDFMWLQSRTPTDGNSNVAEHEEKVKRTAKALDTYLAAMLNQKFSAPIFILSHLPLHYTMRSYKDGDGRYAKFIFDVLNRYGKKGLNLIFLYGHNHSHGWDNYIGGGSVFLAPNSKIYIADPENHQKCTREKNAFIYMNAGFVGYCTTDDPKDGADKTLSMSLFEITDNAILIRRFTPQGPSPLKARGVFNTYNNRQEAKAKFYRPDTKQLDTYRHPLKKLAP